ncbi:MAG: MBL fold metallo-hydrolase [Acidimicrobiales bacterium]
MRTETSSPRPRKQEQEPASDEVVEVAAGILRLQIPINFTGLGHVNSYALIDSKGAAIVDAGLPGKETWSALQKRLKTAGLRVTDVHTVLVTHSHPDHFGSAGRLAHEAGADLVAEASFHTWLERRSVSNGPEDDTGYLALLKARRTPWGGTPFPSSRRQRAVRRLATHGLVRSMRPPVPTRRVDDGDVLMLAGREWRAVHTPGHTGDHLCLYDPTEQVLVSGDHVLPTITPHVGGLTPLADPLGSFLRSLALVLGIGPVNTVLPAHGHPFADLEARIGQIVDHHDDRIGALREIGRDGEPATVVEIARQLFKRPLWGMMAESETFAHLEFLRLRGDAERVELGTGSAGELAYRIDPRGSASAREAAFKTG